MVVINRIGYLRDMIYKGAQVFITVSINPETSVQKVKVIIDSAAALPVQQQSFALEVLRSLESLCSSHAIADRGHKHSLRSGGKSFVHFFLTPLASTDPLTSSADLVGSWTPLVTGFSAPFREMTFARPSSLPNSYSATTSDSQLDTWTNLHANAVPNGLPNTASNSQSDDITNTHPDTADNQPATLTSIMPVLDTLAESIGHIGTSTLELRATAAATAAESSSRIDSLSEGMGNQLRLAQDLQEAYEVRFSELQGQKDSMTQSFNAMRDLL